MNKSISFFLLLFSFAMISPAFAQEDDQDTTTQEKPDFSWMHKQNRHNHHFDNWNFDFPDFGSGKPFMQLSYGRTDNKINSLFESLNKAGFAQVKLGYVHQPVINDSDKVLRFKNHYVEVSFMKDDLWKDNTVGDIKTEALRIGFGWERGYGYEFGKSSLFLTNGFGFNWNRLRVNDIVYRDEDIQKLNYYDDSFRFGITHDANIRMQVIPALSLDASYERSVVFQRVLFWKLSGSLITEAIADGLVDHFIKEVLSSSPVAAPIVNFVLKSGVAYGFAELRKEHMNVPFGGEDPLMQATYKFGMTFNF